MVRSGQPATVLGLSGSSRKHRHLRRRTHLGVPIADALERDTVTESSRDRLRPAMEIAAVPFESVIRVAELAGSKTVETHVVLGVGRGQREDSRSSKLEDRPFEGEQALRMQV